MKCCPMRQETKTSGSASSGWGTLVTTLLWVSLCLPLSAFAQSAEKENPSTLSLTNDYPFGQGISGRFALGSKNFVGLKVTAMHLDNSYIIDFTQKLSDRNRITHTESLILDDTLKNGNLFAAALAFDLRLLLTGLYCDFGYGYIKSYGELTAPTRFAVAEGGQNTIMLDGSFYAAIAHAGYFLPVFDNMGVTAELGLVYPFAHNVKASYAPAAVLSSVDRQIDRNIDQIFTDLPVIPTFTLGVTYKL